MEEPDIVSIPVEQKIDLLTDDFAVLQVNYSILPDLQVGDGEIQVVVANADLAKVEHWYRMYQEQCLSEGKEIPDFQTMDMGKYRETGVMKEEAYVDTSSEAIQKAVRKYEGQEPGELEQKVLQQEQSIRSINNEQYQEFHNNPEFIEITINHETLVQESQLASSWDMERRGMLQAEFQEPGEMESRRWCYLQSRYFEQMMEKHTSDLWNEREAANLKCRWKYGSI